ncbi:MAG: acyltransferase [Mobilicoccus sp.]|nr:acyltransferase [Mobilicoccus sp.]
MAVTETRRGSSTPATPQHPTLESTFDPRHNSLTMMRLALATLVAVSHAMVIGFGHQPTFHTDPRLGSTTMGDLAVDGFFVISGFLVTMSFLRLPSIGRYLWHRSVRIFPAFYACLILTALVVAPIVAALEGRPALSVFPESLTFITHNAALHMFRFDVAGLPVGTENPGVINGALWTLYYEFVCYLGVIVLGVIGALKRRAWLLLAAIGVLWAANIVHTTGLVELPAWQMRRLTFLFLLGTAGYVYARHVRIGRVAALVSLIVVAVAVTTLPDYRALAAPAFAYLCLWAMVRLPFTWNPRTDLSYGMYIFHWPVAVILALLGAGGLGLVPFVAVVVLGTGLVALVSWHLIESPALSRKAMVAPWSRSRAGDLRAG